MKPRTLEIDPQPRAEFRRRIGLPEAMAERKLSCLDAETVAAMIAERMDRLRETAAELRAGKLHPVHAANRIEKIANEISRAKETTS